MGNGLIVLGNVLGNVGIVGHLMMTAQLGR